MIEIIPIGKDTPEHEAALQLRDLIAEEWPEVDNDPRHDVKIFSEVKCPHMKNRVVEIDIVVFLYLWRPLPTRTTTEEGHVIHVKNVCLTIEVKDHSPDRIKFVGDRVIVRYANKADHDASEQAWQQQLSLRNYLGHPKDLPYVVPLIWTRNYSKSVFPREVRATNVVAGGDSWGGFLQKVCSTAPVQYDRTSEKRMVGKRGVGKGTATKAYTAFTKEIPMSPLDRTRVERVTRRLTKDQKYGKKLGEQLLIFRGRGGTGKTVRLLQLANQIYIERGGSVLVLTYNRALVADIRRLLRLMGVNQGAADRSIVIDTVHSFMAKILRGCGILGGEDPRFYERYEAYKEEFLGYVKEAALSKGDLRKMVEGNPDSFDWDFIIVDEAQDWPTNERDILYSLYDHRRFVLADGIDQFVRSDGGGSHRRINWRQGLSIKESQVVSLRRSLRLKGNLCRFINAFAKSMGLEDWEVETNSEVFGGRVIIVEGAYSKAPEAHERLFEEHKRYGNEPIDMLVCIPPELAKESRSGGCSVAAAKFKDWGWQVWDGSFEEERKKGPESLEQLRIVQYDSCRGLEGWTTVNLGFDKLYDRKLCRRLEEVGETDIFSSPERDAHLHAAQWLMIPLTRAIDTLVIQVPLSDHIVKENLRAAAERCEDAVEWRKA